MSENRSMPQVFLIKDNFEDETPQFTSTFLRQLDFDQERRKEIYRAFEPSGDLQHTPKDDLIKGIEPYIRSAVQYGINTESFTNILLTALGRRPQSYFTIRYVTKPITKLPPLNNARRLIIARGEENWYSTVDNDADPNVRWFVHPIFFRYSPKELLDFDPRSDEGENVGDDWYGGRWLVFARLDKTTLSLHWRNFTANNGLIVKNGFKYKNDFPYWLYIPRLITKLEKNLGIETEKIDLQHTILQLVWNEFREKKEVYKWEDIYIKAENKGIKLNAHSSRETVEEFDEDYAGNEDESDNDAMTIEGIRHLARTLRKGIDSRLKQDASYRDGIPSRLYDAIDEQILRTMIAEFRPIAYEFVIQNISENIKQKLFHSRAFFGSIEDNRVKESLQHLRSKNFDKSGLSSLDQLKFLLPFIAEPPKPTVSTTRSFW